MTPERRSAPRRRNGKSLAPVMASSRWRRWRARQSARAIHVATSPRAHRLFAGAGGMLLPGRPHRTSLGRVPAM